MSDMPCVTGSQGADVSTGRAHRLCAQLVEGVHAQVDVKAAVHHLEQVPLRQLRQPLHQAEDNALQLSRTCP